MTIKTELINSMKKIAEYCDDHPLCTRCPLYDDCELELSAHQFSLSELMNKLINGVRTNDN